MSSITVNALTGVPGAFGTTATSWTPVTMRFRPQIPNGATVTSAYVSFGCNLSSGAEPPSGISLQISSMSSSGAVVSWGYVSQWSSGSSYMSPSIASAINTIVNASGWDPGEEIMIRPTQSGSDAPTITSRNYGSATLNITYDNIPTCNLHADQSSIEVGDSTWLRWECTNADSASIDQGIGSVNAISSSTGGESPELVSPTTTTTYTLTAISSTGSTATSSVTITVNEPPAPPVGYPSISLVALNSVIDEGDSTTITWNSTDAVTVVIDNGIGSVAVDGSSLVSPTITTTYRATATSSSGNTAVASTTITVIPSPEPPPPPPPPPDPDPLYLVNTSATINAGASSFNASEPESFHPLNWIGIIAEPDIDEAVTMADEYTANVEYGGAEMGILVELSEGMTTSDGNFAELPGESESEESAVSGESFTTSDEITAESTSKFLTEEMLLSDSIVGDTPRRNIDEDVTLTDTFSSAESVMNTTNAEVVEISAEILGGFDIPAVTDEDVTTADVIVAEKHLGVAFQNENLTTSADISVVKQGMGFAITEVHQIFDALGFGWIKTLTSTAAITDTVTIETAWRIDEILTAEDVIVTKWAGSESVESVLGIFGNALIAQIFNEAVTSISTAVDAVAYLHKMISVAESTFGIVDTVSSKATFNPLVVEAVAVVGMLSVLHTLNPVISESSEIVDIVQPGWLKAISDGGAIVDTAAIQWVAMHILTESMILTDTAVGLFNLTDAISDTFEAAAAVVIQQILQESVTDILNFGITIMLDDELWSCWVLNGNAFNVSIYSGFDFNSYATYNNVSYGCRADGIYKLAGATDGGAAFHSGIVLPETDFSSSRKKRFRKAYFGLSGSSPSIRMETSSGNITYNITNSKSNINRSQYGKEWTVKLQDFDTMEFIELIPIILTR